MSRPSGAHSPYSGCIQRARRIWDGEPATMRGWNRNSGAVEVRNILGVKFDRKSVKSAAFGLVMIGAALAPAAALADDSLPAGPGKDALERACAVCHAAETVTMFNKDENGWAQTLDSMIGRGAEVSEPDYKVILAYLTQHFGVGPTPAAAAPAAPPAATK